MIIAAGQKMSMPVVQPSMIPPIIEHASVASKATMVYPIGNSGSFSNRVGKRLRAMLSRGSMRPRIKATQSAMKT